MPKKTKTPTKHCVRCGEELPATTEYFYEDKARVGGLRNSCKPCWTEQTKDAGWGSTSREKRNRKPIALTLPDETRAKLDLMAHRLDSSRSEVVEILINEAVMPGDDEDGDD